MPRNRKVPKPTEVPPVRRSERKRNQPQLELNVSNNTKSGSSRLAPMQKIPKPAEVSPVRRSDRKSNQPQPELNVRKKAKFSTISPKQKIPKPTKVPPVRGSDRENNQAQPGSSLVETACSTRISDLPKELLLKIFSFLPKEDIYFKVRLVCKQWNILAKDATLWKWISDAVDINYLKKPTVRIITTSRLLKWISIASLLRKLILFNEYDLNMVLEKVAENCKQLQTLRVYPRFGWVKCSELSDAIMCKLLKECPKLSVIQLCMVEFALGESFQLLLKCITEKKITGCRYSGLIKYTELCALLQLILKSAGISSAVKKPALLACQLTEGRKSYNYDLRLDHENATRCLIIIESKRHKKKAAVIRWKPEKGEEKIEFVEDFKDFMFCIYGFYI